MEFAFAFDVAIKGRRRKKKVSRTVASEVACQSPHRPAAHHTQPLACVHMIPRGVQGALHENIRCDPKGTDAATSRVVRLVAGGTKRPVRATNVTNRPSWDHAITRYQSEAADGAEYHRACRRGEKSRLAPPSQFLAMVKRVLSARHQVSCRSSAGLCRERCSEPLVFVSQGPSMCSKLCPSIADNRADKAIREWRSERGVDTCRRPVLQL